MRLDKLSLIQRETSKRLGGYNGNAKVDGASNYVSPSAERVTIVGDNNIVHNEARNISLINCFSVIVNAGVANVMVVDTNGITINESDVSFINGVKIKDGIVIQADTTLIVDGGRNTLQKVFGCNTIEVVDGGLDCIRQYNSQSNISVLNGSSTAV